MMIGHLWLLCEMVLRTFFGVGIDLNRSLYYRNLFDGSICGLVGYFLGIREHFLFGYGYFFSLSG